MKPVCVRCGKLVPLHELPLFFVGELLLSFIPVQTAGYVCGKCSQSVTQQQIKENGER